MRQKRELKTETNARRVNQACLILMIRGRLVLPSRWPTEATNLRRGIWVCRLDWRERSSSKYKAADLDCCSRMGSRSSFPGPLSSFAILLFFAIAVVKCCNSHAKGVWKTLLYKSFFNNGFPVESSGALSQTPMHMRNPIIVALDVPSVDRALKLASELADVVGAFKIGSELFTTAGPDIVRQIRAAGGSVFLDLKYHDIPNTVAKAVAAATRMDVQMLTIHTCGGTEMMRAAAQSAQETAKELGRPAPLVLGVTVLTSMDEAGLRETNVDATPAAQVVHLAGLAAKAGMTGLVCSPLEVESLRKLLPSEMQLVIPGIRTGKEKADDQKRTLGPAEAIRLGASWLVIGRPIYAAENPRAAAEAILQSLNQP